jgi:hypothetical protein
MAEVPGADFGKILHPYLVVLTKWGTFCVITLPKIVLLIICASCTRKNMWRKGNVIVEVLEALVMLRGFG